MGKKIMENNKNPKISIITVTLNARDLLENTIKSVAAQTYKNIEYIVVDGASTDGTVDVIKKYNKFIIKWISKLDKGIYFAMNKGLSLATGDYVWFLNAGDEIYKPETLENILSSKNNADFYYGGIFVVGGNFDDKDRVVMPAKISNWQNAYKYNYGNLCHQTVIVKINLIEKYNTSYKSASDVDWVINVLKKSKDVFRFEGIITKFLFGGFSFHNKIRSRYEFSKIIFKNRLYGKFIMLLPRLFIFIPIDDGVNKIEIFFKKLNPKLYYFLKSLLRIKSKPF